MMDFIIFNTTLAVKPRFTHKACFRERKLSAGKLSDPENWGTESWGFTVLQQDLNFP